MKKDKKSTSPIAIVCFGTILSVCGIILLPKLVDKSGRKIYKKSHHASKINYDEMGPVIRRK